jgi:hypothetical protein
MTYFEEQAKIAYEAQPVFLDGNEFQTLKLNILLLKSFLQIKNTFFNSLTVSQTIKKGIQYFNTYNHTTASRHS